MKSSPTLRSERRSWSEALPALTPDDIEIRSRVAPARARLEPWGAQLIAHLPAAMAPWWPYSGVGEFTLVFGLRETSGEEREVRLCHSPVRIGRGEACHIQLPDPTVSTEHAELRVDGSRVKLLDLRSTNGTLHNGKAMAPLAGVPLAVGDRVTIGSYVLELHDFRLGQAQAASPAIRGGAFRPLKQARPFHLLALPSDRWVRIRWAGETAWLKIPAAWIRSCWQRLTEIELDDEGAPGPLEEGAAQFVLARIASSLGKALQVPFDLSAWLTGEESDRLAGEQRDWLHADLWLAEPSAELSTLVLVSVPEPTARRGFPDLGELAWPASVYLGLIRLRLSDWRTVDSGDALLPDVWLPSQWEGGNEKDRSLGPATVKLGRFWHEGELRLEAGRLRVALEKTWSHSAGGGWSMADKETSVGEVEAVPVDELELQVLIELDRLPVTLAEVKRWHAGYCLTLQRGPDEPVRLVLDTGIQRRVLAEGRVVMVDGKLGIEVIRILTQLQDAPAKT